jgi:hypothetical protein
LREFICVQSLGLPYYVCWWNARPNGSETGLELIERLRKQSMNISSIYQKTLPLFSVLFLLLLGAPALQAQFEYTTNADGASVTITGYTGTGGDVIIPAIINNLAVTSIGTNAFEDCATLTGVIIPEGVTSIGAEAFLACNNMTNATISDTVTNIAEAAFYGCASLAGITIPASVANIGAEAFDQCSQMSSLTISDGVTNIGPEAFYECGDLIGLTIPASVTSIGNEAFGLCINLTEITVASQNPSYSSLNNVLFNKSHTTLIEYPCGLNGSYVIPASVTNIEDAAFDGCTGLTAVAIPASVTSIGEYAFAYCYNMAAAAIPGSVTNIADHAFYGCNELGSITLPGNLMNIGAEAFYGCYQVTDVTIPASVTSIGTGAFEWCTSLKTITTPAQNLFYSSVNGVLFDKSQTALLEFPGGVGGSYAIPEGVTSIGASAFEGCDSLANVMIPSSVTSVGDYAFAYCYDLNSVAIPDSVTNLGNYTFYGCEDLTNAAIPESVTSLGDDVFYGCYGLTRLTIPGSVTNFGEDALAWCVHLTNIFFEGDAPSADATVFAHDNALPTAFYLPGATGWSSAFDGLPAVLWKAFIQTADGSFGVKSNQFGFNIAAATNLPVVVEASTNLSDPQWTLLQNLTLSNGSFYFSDPEWTNYSARYYRVGFP